MRAGAFCFPFHLSLGSPFAGSSFPVSAWLVSSPSLVASWCRAWCWAYHRRAAALFGFSFLPSRSIYPFRPCGFVRFPHIGLKPGNVRRFCQLVSPHSLRSSSLVSVRLVPLLVLPVSCGVSSLFFAFAVRLSSRLAHQFVRRSVVSSRPAVRFPVLFIVPRCFALPGSSFLVSCSRLVCSSRQAVRILSFRLADRLGGLWCRVVFIPVSFSSVLISFVRCVSCGRDDGGGSSFSYRSGVLSSPLPPVVESD